MKAYDSFTGALIPLKDLLRVSLGDWNGAYCKQRPSIVVRHGKNIIMSHRVPRRVQFIGDRWQDFCDVYFVSAYLSNVRAVEPSIYWSYHKLAVLCLRYVLPQSFWKWYCPTMYRKVRVFTNYAWFFSRMRLMIECGIVKKSPKWLVPFEDTQKRFGPQPRYPQLSGKSKVKKNLLQFPEDNIRS